VYSPLTIEGRSYTKPSGSKSFPESTHSGAQYIICTVKLNEESSKYPGLVQENGFSSP
jgi:hypothetical protein